MVQFSKREFQKRELLLHCIIVILVLLAANCVLTRDKSCLRFAHIMAWHGDYVDQPYNIIIVHKTNRRCVFPN